MDNKINQKTYITLLSTYFQGRKRILKILMTLKRNGLIILLAVILTVGMLGGVVGCAMDDSKEKLKNSVRYEGTDYVLHEDIGLNLDGFSDFHEGLGELCEKVGTLGQAGVYKIHGLEQRDWIFLDNNSMLSSDAPFGGIYRSSKVKMDTIADFKPDFLNFFYLTPPTSQQSGSEKHIFATKDLKIIERITAAIENGKTVSTEKHTEVTKAMLYGDSSYQSYRLEFLSDSYPKLVYRLNYTEDPNGRYYIGFYGDITPYKIIEIDNTLHEYLPAETSLDE
ncbi:MAG: hypothetical protein GXW85_12385 [Clostridia bacterium]|nr:hypothetical protein [Clostridia bacterium]